MKNLIHITKNLVSKVALQTYFFILGLVLSNSGIFLFSLDLGLISSGLTLVLLAVIINIEKEGGK